MLISFSFTKSSWIIIWIPHRWPNG